ncbi:MAG TPA: SGNH/GDSL hydrolase family protein [Puia sp.]
MRTKHLSCMGMAVTLMLACTTSLMAQNRKMPVRENIEWLDVWMPDTNNSLLPRILLIGNSITRGYYPEVQKILEGKAYVARLTTSKSIGDPALLKEVDLIMSYYKFDVVHFNNGLHGFGYTEEEYSAAFPAFIKKIRKKAPHAKLIWATITPLHTKADMSLLDPKTDRIKARNKIALDFIAKQKDIRIDSLWEFTINHPEFYEGGDGAHPNPSGYHALSEKVAAELSAVIDEKK